MALHIHTAEQSSGGAIIRSDRRLYLTADEKTVVEEGDVRARFLLSGAGAGIEAARAQELGLTVVDGKVVLATASEAATDSAAATEPTSSEGAESPTDLKEREAPEDKQREQPENKASKKERR